MRRLRIVLIALALLLTPALVLPGVSNALPITWTGGTNREAIEFVLQRGLAQRGVPYSYGGGNPDGPSAGTGSSPATPAPATPSTTVTPGLTGPTPLAQPAPGLGVPGFGPAPTTAPTTTAAPAPKVVGFDSSGLVQYAFAGVGIKLPRSSGEQYKVGRKVLPAEALPGDLIFYGPDGSQSVALFLGDGKMLESTPPAVVVSPVRTDSMAPYLSRIIEWQ